ncbi:MAG: DUF5654 family protein [Methanomassiliicoccaceae archaeon]|nr:DUF5654 family protein [Methanomassiliicoccaceae archaeon]
MKSDTKLQFVTTFSALITAAFGLVAALAWNTAIKAAIDEIFQKENDLMGYFVYAILVTILAVIMIIIIARQTKKLTDQIKAEEEKK